jgi:hypothetical protein
MVKIGKKLKTTLKPTSSSSDESFDSQEEQKVEQEIEVEPPIEEAVDKTNDNEVMTEMETLLGFKPKAETEKRSEDDIASASVYCAKEKRAALSEDALRKLQEVCEKGLEVPFKLIEIKEGAAELGDIYSLGIRMKEFKDSLIKFQMDDVFKIIRFDATNNPKEVKCLFKDYVNITLEEVKKSTKFYNERGCSWHPQNTMWSLRKLEGSIDENLKDKLAERLQGFTTAEVGGPTGLKIVLDLISSTNVRALRSILVKIQKLTLQEFAGENVSTAASWFRGAAQVLKAGNAFPIDFNMMIFTTLKTASSDEFKFKMISYETQGLSGFGELQDFDQILSFAETEYRVLSQKEKWAGLKHKGSIFLQREGKKDKKDIKCHKCGKMGHYQRECRSKPSPTDGNKGTPTDGTTKTVNPKKQPPKKGDAHEKQFSDGKHFWCGREGTWLKENHKEHPEKCPKYKKDATSATPTPTTTPSATTTAGAASLASVSLPFTGR